MRIGDNNLFEIGCRECRRPQLVIVNDEAVQIL